MKDLNNVGVPDITGTDYLDIRPISGWFDEWLEGIKTEQNMISLKFPMFDHEMRGKLRGKLCVIIHYGGTKKSLLAQNIAHHNIFNYDCRVIYSSMEMGVVELGSRFIDLLIDSGEVNASYDLERGNKNNPNYALNILNKHVAPGYGNKLLITQNSGLTTEDYNKLNERVTKEHGKSDILIVDGLSMMGGKGSELELANIHTRSLKEFAKDNNMLVICIVHASRGGEKHHRDVSKHARGSEKIIDNCDFYICPSLISDSSSIGEDAEYRKDQGYLRLVNKRGSGNTINLIYEFNPYRLLMTQTDINPFVIDKGNGKATGF